MAGRSEFHGFRLIGELILFALIAPVVLMTAIFIAPIALVALPIFLAWSIQNGGGPELHHDDKLPYRRQRRVPPPPELNRLLLVVVRFDVNRHVTEPIELRLQPRLDGVADLVRARQRQPAVDLHVQIELVGAGDAA